MHYVMKFYYQITEMALFMPHTCLPIGTEIIIQMVHCGTVVFSEYVKIRSEIVNEGRGCIFYTFYFITNFTGLHILHVREPSACALTSGTP